MLSVLPGICFSSQISTIYETTNLTRTTPSLWTLNVCAMRIKVYEILFNFTDYLYKETHFFFFTFKSFFLLVGIFFDSAGVRLLFYLVYHFKFNKDIYSLGDIR